MIRLFVGLALPAAIGVPLAALGAGLPGARWVERRNLHVTLRFVGDVDETVGHELHQSLAAVRAPAFDLALEGFGTFGSRSPNALWAGVERAPGLMHLQAKVESAAVRAGLEPERRRYQPHVTLARLKDTPIARLQAFIAAHSPYRAGPFPVEGFVLFRSHLGRGGAEYEAVAEYGLG
ncbi:RNA 2',3'-cyclic phosphodiesterase [Magnetospirillum sp. UT-4]|uniref:RNA 2',3'-cyclic phosphodiesterase n=1 Tax=Magnetospirillum sp. UT-4 TaxID=2681467 RepID=UPI00137D83F8|nr:RNA 2',3'-cyclic phosphodiesterase [Magnetospirillum sp. UT-4]CAA7624410.1 2',5' RNA ligase [Magnetospirillum sp. UT-4]